jgi:hypothetical protein
MKYPTEHEDQKAVYAFCLHMCSTYPGLGLIYAIPNGFRASSEACVWMMSEGMRKGFPDLGLPVARGGYHGLFMELKRKGGQNPRKEQVAWLQRLADQGFYACCCKGREAAKDTLVKYITGEIRLNG